MKYDVIFLTCVVGKVLTRGIGPYRMASHLRQHGISTQVIDFTERFTAEELIETVEQFIGPNTKILGLSSTFYSNFLSIKQNIQHNPIDGVQSNIFPVLKLIKEKYKHVKLAVGGANSYKFIQGDLFDIVVQGYSEDIFLEYLTSKRLYPKLNNKVILDGSTRQFDIENLIHRWADNDAILPGETLPIEISRGCIFQCKFCNYPLNGKSKYDYLRDPKLIVDEIVDNYERFGVTNYFFADDTFNDSTYKVERLHNEITKLPFKINFTTYLRLDLLYKHREQILLLKEMGLKSAFFGIESLNQKTANFIGKGMKVEKVKDFLLDLKNEIWKDEINYICTFILGLPYENIESSLQSFEWCKQNNINSAWAPLSLEINAKDKSWLGINYEKCGYVLTNEKTGAWKNDITTYEETVRVSNQINQFALYNNVPTSWFLFALLNYGIHTCKELMEIKIKDIPEALYEKRDSELIAYYKKTLRN